MSHAIGFDKRCMVAMQRFFLRLGFGRMAAGKPAFSIESADDVAGAAYNPKAATNLRSRTQFSDVAVGLILAGLA